MNHGSRKPLIERISRRSDSILEAFEGKTVSILGGSGFIGSWISEVFRYQIEQGLRCNVKVLSRSGSLTTQIDLGNRSNYFKSFKVDLSGEIPDEIRDSDYFLIAATASSPSHGGNDGKMIERTTKGIVAYLEELAVTPLSKDKKLVHLSSGAVHRIHGVAKSKYPEDDDVSRHSRNPYIQAKIDLEMASRKLQSGNSGWRVSNPRIFTLYGPGLATDAHFAIGNFVASGIRKQNIEIHGNPETVRSYLHIADLTVAILKLLANPVYSPINLGSSIPIRMSNLAESVAAHFPASRVIQRDNSSSPSYYVPETNTAVNYLGQIESIDFSEGIQDWIEWLEKYQSE